MQWIADRGPAPSDMPADALAVIVYDYVDGWRFAGFVTALGSATNAEALRFAAQDASVGGRPVFAKKITATTDIKWPRRTVQQPPATVDVTVEDYAGQDAEPEPLPDPGTPEPGP
jgi:hypothetical protein